LFAEAEKKDGDENRPQSRACRPLSFEIRPTERGGREALWVESRGKVRGGSGVEEYNLLPRFGLFRVQLLLSFGGLLVRFGHEGDCSPFVKFSGGGF
jgi:hypothetical protein